MSVASVRPLCVCGHPESDHKWMGVSGEYAGIAEVMTCYPCHEVHKGSDPYTGCTEYRPVPIIEEAQRQSVAEQLNRIEQHLRDESDAARARFYGVPPSMARRPRERT